MRELQVQSEQQQGLDKLKTRVRQVGDIVQKTFAMFGADAELQQGIGQLTAGIEDGIDAFAKFSSGDILGGISSVLSGIMNIGNAIENLDPGLKAWKKGLLEVAAVEKEMMGARSYGNIANPYYDALSKDIAERERAGNSKWYQRLGWAIFGGAPEYMSAEAAKLTAKSAQIFGEVAETVSSSMDSAFMNAFETGDWTGTEAAMEKSLNSLMAKMALQAIVAASGLEKKIKAYADARARALENDGKIDATEQAGLDALWQGILAGQREVMSTWKQEAQKLPGYGQNRSEDTTTSTTPTPPSDTLRTVRVEMPKVEASMNFDVLGTLATVIERAAPRIEAGGQAVERGAGVFTAQVDRLERILAAAELKPNARALKGL